ncbi:hypothetical protein LTR94_030388, partial [Friedmanniomyces endolithicus]
PHPRIEGPLKTTGRAVYSYENHEAAPNAAYGYVVGSAIAKGRVRSFDLSAVRASPGVIDVVTHETAGELDKGRFNTAKLLGGPEIEHYHQALAVVIAETFEQARAAAAKLKISYARQDGRFDLKSETAKAQITEQGSDVATGDLEAAFAASEVQLDEHYETPDHSHAMMEPHASIARWDGDALFVWTSNQMIAWGKADLARTLKMPPEK